MAVSTRISFKLTVDQTRVLDLATGSTPLNISKDYTWADGTGANQADRVWHDQRVTTGTDSLDLSGVLLDIYGAAFTLAKIKAIYLFNAAASTGNARLTRPATNGVPVFLAAGDALEVLPGGLAAWVAPNLAAIAVTAGTGDLLDVVASAGSVTYDIVIVGTSA